MFPLSSGVSRSHAPPASPVKQGEPLCTTPMRHPPCIYHGLHLDNRCRENSICPSRIAGNPGANRPAAPWHVLSLLSPRRVSILRHRVIALDTQRSDGSIVLSRVSPLAMLAGSCPRISISACKWRSFRLQFLPKQFQSGAVIELRRCSSATLKIRPCQP